MKYAETIRDIPNAFDLWPLTKKDLERFYYNGTMEVRMGDPNDSPIEDIFEDCHEPSERSAWLLLGHRGCGKSTELNEMSERLRSEGIPVRTVQCGEDLDLENPAYADLLILMGEALLDIAINEVQCDPAPGVVRTIREFWTDVEIERIRSHEIGAEIEAGAKLEKKFGEASAKILQTPVLSLFVEAKPELKYSDQTRTIYREQVKKRVSNWLAAMDEIAGQISDRLDGKQPVIIFEDLDKLEPDEAWEVFHAHSRKLTDVTFPVIYTFPIGLCYDARFAAMEGYFKPRIFPMIKLTYRNGDDYDKGRETLLQIVRMRMDLSLIEEDALNHLIRMTGGSLRDLFRAITKCSTRARRRHDGKIRMEDAERALEEQKSMLTRRIEEKDYDFLAKICAGNRTNIENRKMLLEMLMAGIVLEYNDAGIHWHNVHPLVADFLRMQGLIEDD